MELGFQEPTGSKLKSWRVENKTASSAGAPRFLVQKLKHHQMKSTKHIMDPKGSNVVRGLGSILESF